MVEAILGGLVGGLIGGVLFNWRTWRDLWVDLRYHGFDNHLCSRVGCCR